MNTTELVQQALFYKRKLLQGDYSKAYLESLRSKYGPRAFVLEEFIDRLLLTPVWFPERVKAYANNTTVKHTGKMKRVDDRGVLAACLPASLKPAQLKMYGQGGYATVFIGDDEPDILYKIEQLLQLRNTHPGALLVHNTRAHLNADPLARFEEIKAICEKAAAVRVGPAIRDMFICESGSTYYVVTIMERVPGIQWAEWKPVNEEARRTGVALLERQMMRLGRAGILHMDLHGWNIIVDVGARGKPKRVRIIDYNSATWSTAMDRATSVLEKEEPRTNPMLWLPYLLIEKGVISWPRRVEGPAWYRESLNTESDSGTRSATKEI